MPELVTVVRAFVERHNGKMVYTRRSADEFAGGLWCLPGGKVERGETHKGALLRELAEEIGGIPDSGIRYCFSQEPVPHNGKLYRQDYFHVDIEYAMLRRGSDIEALAVLWPGDALLLDGITFANGVAHHFHDSMRRAGVRFPGWELADACFQGTGSIPEPRSYAPHLSPLRSREELLRWMQANSPVPAENIETALDRWMSRNGLADAAEVAAYRERIARRALAEYCLPHRNESL